MNYQSRGTDLLYQKRKGCQWFLVPQEELIRLALLGIENERKLTPRAADGDQDEPLSLEMEYNNCQARYVEMKKHCENQRIHIRKLEMSVAQLHKNHPPLT